MLTPAALEEITLNAWPGLQTVLYDGWVLRFAEGYTRRANAIYPHAAPRDLDARLAFCASLYQPRGLPLIVKLADGVAPAGLDAELAARGFREDAPTAVHIVDITDRPAANGGEVRLSAAPDDTWLAAFARMSGLTAQQQGVLALIIANIIPAHVCAFIILDGRVAATGLGVAQSGVVGVYDIVTDPACRGRGFAGQIVESLLAWGRDQGASAAYLQVMLDNQAALRLYARLGFCEFYRYHYRVRSS